jgi:large subunit ribosomal protein L22
MATNTEKPTTKTEQKKQGIVKTPVKKQEIKKIPKTLDTKITEASEEKKPAEKPKKPIQKKPVVKKTCAVVNATSLPISTKASIAICRFIKNKKINQAITDLEQVVLTKKSVPMKGEIPHRKGKGMMSGRFPKKASEHFINLLKTLRANANANEMDAPIISQAIANLAPRPYGRFGRIKRKRTHVKIMVKEKKLNKKEKKIGGKNANKN